MIQRTESVVARPTDPMRHASGTNLHTLLFWYRTNPIVEIDHSDRSPSSVDECSTLPRPNYRRTSSLTSYVYHESRPYCPTCTHDTQRIPFCGGDVCATVQYEQAMELAWSRLLEQSDASDGEPCPSDDVDEYYER